VAKSLLLGPETGLAPVVQAGSDADLDDFSNLEVTPALLHEEQFHPYGRIVAGMDAQSGAAPSPELLALLAAQAAQGDAVLVDTSWLRSRHVDEIVGWIPFLGGPGCCGKGFVLLLPDTIRMLALLEEVAAAGHGDAVVLSGTEQETTVDALLANAALLDFNAGLQEKLDDLRTQLASELQLVDEDIVLLPALFAPFSDDDPAAVPLFPSPIAGVVVGKLLILPAPHGPEVDDSDALRVRVEELLAPYSVVLTFVDDLVPYHTAGGSLHRGTQVRRLPTNLEWWMNL
jgi:hypothetical protein